MKTETLSECVSQGMYVSSVAEQCDVDEGVNTEYWLTSVTAGMYVEVSSEVTSHSSPTFLNR